MTSLITLSKAGKQVTIGVTNVEEVLNKQLTNLVIPQSSGNWASGPKDTKILDLLKIERRFNVDGVIHDDIASGDTSSTAFNRVTDLRNMFNGGGVFTMNYAGTAFSVNLEKLMITEKGTDSQSTPSDTPQTYEIKFTAIVGVNL